jgi:hypothetical protein
MFLVTGLRPSASHSGWLRLVCISLLICSIVGGITVSLAGAQTGCCTVRGNTDCSPDGIVDISDLTRLIDYLYISLDPLCCVDAANTDGSSDGIVDISDLTRMIDHLFISLNPMEPCGGTMTYEQRDTLFYALDSAFSSLQSLPAETLAVRLATFLNTRPEIDSAGVVDGISVWAWFVDGWILSIPNNRTPSGGSLPIMESSFTESYDVPAGFSLPSRRFPKLLNPAVAAESTERTLHTPSQLNVELPISIDARVTSTLGSPPFTVGAPIIKSLLENNGYVVTPFSGSVSSLFSIQNEGVFYMDAHGGSCPDKGGTQHLAIWTSTVRSRTNDSLLKPLLDRAELVIMWANDNNPISGAVQVHARYAFTGNFVAQYMSFAQQSFVFINACQTDSVPSLRMGFSAAGASTFCGWSKVVNDGGANRAAEFLFDRMLGANNSSLTPKESPPQRPFDIDQLYQDMVSRGFDTDPQAPNAKLHVRHLNDNFGLLAPSILFLSIKEAADSLIIVGMFGGNPGTAGRVIVGGTDLLIYSWDTTQIKCFIPNTGAGSVGPVHVEVDGQVGPSTSVKRKSNVVNLTEWRGDLVYKHVQAGTLTGTITVHAHLRADLHPFREKPHEKPWNPAVFFNAAQDAYGEGAASGTFTIDYGPGMSATYTWSGTATMPGIWESDQDRLQLWGSINPVTKQLILHLSGNTRPELDEVYTSTIFPGYTQKFYLPFNPELMDDPLASDLYLTLTNTFDIPPGQRDTTGYSTYDPFNPATYQLKWNLIQSSFPPDTTAGQ